jgi:hypothetical protein
LEFNETSGFSDKFGNNPDVSSDEEEGSNDGSQQEEAVDDEEQKIEREPTPPPQPKVSKKKKFKLVGLDSSRDFQSFAPSDEYEQNPARQVRR